MQIVFQASGSIKDGKKAGVGALSAKLLNEGTKKLGSVNFANLLEQKAVHLSATCGFETFVLEISSLESEFEYSLKMLKELLNDPNYTQDTFKKIKTATIGSIMRKESDFDHIASKNLNELVFKNTPMQYPSSGTIESLKSINLEDLKNFINTYLVLENAIVVIGGALEEQKAIEYSKDVLSLLKNGKKSSIEYFNPNDKSEIKKVFKDTQQSYIYFASPFYVKSTDIDSYKSKVAMFILGSSGFGSRIMEEIRVKRGLAYSAYARVHSNNSHSYLSGYMQTKLENEEESIKLIKEIIKDFIANGVTQKELDGAKKFLLGSEPLRNETLNQRLSKTFNEYYKNLGIGYSEKELKLIEQLTLEDLNGFIASHDEILKLTFSIVTLAQKQ
ncbi:MAG: insulinase family protein [Campylobacterales bacterium]|nr:insulinase family protein [Campylobacterales bacterium]